VRDDAIVLVDRADALVRVRDFMTGLTLTRHPWRIRTSDNRYAFLIRLVAVVLPKFRPIPSLLKLPAALPLGACQSLM
jgi:hypothetical protein